LGHLGPYSDLTFTFPSPLPRRIITMTTYIHVVVVVFSPLWDCGYRHGNGSVKQSFSFYRLLLTPLFAPFFISVVMGTKTSKLFEDAQERGTTTLNLSNNRLSVLSPEVEVLKETLQRSAAPNVSPP